MTAAVCSLSWPAAVVLSVAAVCFTLLLIAVIFASVETRASANTLPTGGSAAAGGRVFGGSQGRRAGKPEGTRAVQESPPSGARP